MNDVRLPAFIEPAARPTVTMSRRELVSGLAAGTVVAFSGAGLSGCTTNEALGRRQLILVSDAELEAMSASAWSEALRTQKQVSNPASRRRIAAIGDRIVRAADARNPGANLTAKNWDYAVFEDDTVNAWVMPGGRVAFHSALLDVTQNDDQVATVMGHEVGHVVGRHAAERASQQMAAQGGMALANVALADNENRNLIAGVLGAGVNLGVILPYSRQHEYEADRLGTDYMVGADYRANEAIRFWDGMTQRNTRQSSAFMSTHPSDESRIATLRSYIGSQGYA
ncbi:MAG: M48 family metallopeptidase [Pseudomonadota bacterium]